MHPALSVIFFSVTSGAGYGMLVLLVLGRYARVVPDLSANQVTLAGFTGLVLVTLGLVSSTFHLANPRNAWRSFTRFRTSWLSREAVFAVAFYPLCLLWLWSEWSSGPTTVSTVLGGLVVLVAFAVLVCTSMIYASLKTIRQWHTPLVPINFLLLGLTLGALVLLLFFAQKALPLGWMTTMTIVLLLIAAVCKLAYFFWIGQPAGPSINSALGFTRATVRLLDVGHSSGTFLTDEFGYQLARAKLQWLRVVVVCAAFLLPLLLLSGVVFSGGFTLVLFATLSAWSGVFIERWLFFAEARHVVNLYHGAQTT